MHKRCQLLLSNFGTGIDNVLIPHLTEPAPFMRQVLSPIGAHSVSGGTLLDITGCRPESPWGTERTFHSLSSSSTGSFS